MTRECLLSCWAAIALCACAEGRPTTVSDEHAASIAFALAPGFDSGSLRICGARDVAPNAGYACDASIPCTCYEFDGSGAVVDAMGDPLVLTGLCSSASEPPSPWTFRYEIWDGPGCTGNHINTPESDLVCYDASDIRAQANPNESVETLVPGLNTNHIVCMALGATKTWRYASCEDTTTAADMASNRLRYDCGCTPAGGMGGSGGTGGTCDCAFANTGLEPGCDFDSMCDVVCKPPVRFQCDGTLYILTGNPSTLNRLDPATRTLIPIGTAPANIGLINGLGARSDGYMYAVTDNMTAGYTQHLIRVFGDGTFVDLGPLAGLTGRVIAGTMLNSGRYMVYANGQQKFMVINVDTVSIASVFAPAKAPDNFADIAAHPTTGAVWAFGPNSNALGTIDRKTGEFTAVYGPVFPPGNPNWVTGSAFFDAAGTLYFYGSPANNSASTTQNRLYSVNVATGVMTLVGPGPEVVNSDGASCFPPPVTP